MMRAFLLLGLASLSSGCAVITENPDGTRRIFGLVNMTIQSTPSGSEKIPSQGGVDAVRVRALGLSMLTGDKHTAVTLGFSDDTLVSIRSNSCIRLDYAVDVPVHVSPMIVKQELFQTGASQ